MPEVIPEVLVTIKVVPELPVELYCVVTAA
jgi:hypothetical protein